MARAASTLSLTKIAWGLARNAAPEHRWRRVAVPVTAAIAMALCLSAASLVLMIGHEEDRESARTLLPAITESPTDLIVRPIADDWRGTQYATVWIEPASETAPVLPPGVTRLPEPGQAVVSPALDRLAREEPVLAARYPDRLVLTSEGIRGGDELFAYIRPAEGRTLVGGATIRVGAFGPSTNEWPGNETGLATPIEPLPLAQGVAGLLVLPGLIILTVGAAAASTVRDHRFQLLVALGASRRSMLSLAVLEHLLLAVPGLASATIIWLLVAPRVEEVPLVEHGVVRGDLAIPLGLAGLLFAAGIIVSTCASVGIAMLRERRRTAGPRPTSGRTAVSRLRYVPLGLASALAIAGARVGGLDGSRLIIAAVIVSLAAIPVILPEAVRLIGAELSALRSVPALLAGRMLQWDAVRATRPFAALATLVLVTLATTAYIARVNENDPVYIPDTGPAAATISWSDTQPEDLRRVQEALGFGVVVPILHGATPDNRPTFTIGATCVEVSPYLAGASCDPGDPYTLPPEADAAFDAMLVGPEMDLSLVPRDNMISGERGSTRSVLALVLADLSPAELHDRVGTAAMRTLTAPQVIDLTMAGQRESPLNQWIIGGLIAALIALAVGCFVMLVDRLLATRGRRTHLLTIGVTQGRLAGLEAWLFAAPYASVVLVSMAAGLILCLPLLSIGNVPVPIGSFGFVAGVVVLAGAIGTGAVAFLGARSVERNEAKRR